MAMIHCTFPSTVLGREVNIAVILPDLLEREGFRPVGYKALGTRFKTVYLLHGKGGNEWDWIRQTGIERYAAKKGIALVMPAAEDLFYVNGPVCRFADFIGKELVEATRLMFPLSPKREDTYVAGLSMGGYGALHTLFTFPDTFAEGASLSGVVDIVATVKRDMVPGSFGYAALKNSFGSAEGVEGSENDLMYLVGQLQREKRLPHFWVSTGTEDPFYENTLHFKEFLEENNVDFTYREGPGAHTWEVWDRDIQSVFDLWF